MKENKIQLVNGTSFEVFSSHAGLVAFLQDRVGSSPQRGQRAALLTWTRAHSAPHDSPQPWTDKDPIPSHTRLLAAGEVIGPHRLVPPSTWRSISAGLQALGNHVLLQKPSSPSTVHVPSSLLAPKLLLQLLPLTLGRGPCLSHLEKLVKGHNLHFLSSIHTIYSGSLTSPRAPDPAASLGLGCSSF